MTNIEAMKLALDALEGGLWDYGPGQDEHDKCNEVIAALRLQIRKYEMMKELRIKAEANIPEWVDVDDYEAEQATVKDSLTTQNHIGEANEMVELNLNCKSVQKRLATSWGYVKAEQEPVAWILTESDGTMDFDCQPTIRPTQSDFDALREGETFTPLYTAPPRAEQATVNDSLTTQYHIGEANEMVTEQKPVAWRCTRGDISDINYANDDESLKYFERRNYDISPLYTAPPQREWVEPTIFQIDDACAGTQSFGEVARAVLKLSKELNHG